jgi:hypothetical protein
VRRSAFPINTIAASLTPAPDYFVASWAQGSDAAEKLNAFNPSAIYAALHK